MEPMITAVLLKRFIPGINLLSMNPENRGEQVKMRHSSLWRKPLLYEKPIPKTSACHTQLNQLAKTGVSWRVRNNSISTHSKFNTSYSIPRKGHSKQLSQILQAGQRSSNEARQMMKSFRQDAEKIDQSDKLVNGMQELKKMNLLLSRNLQKIKFPGVARYTHIHNDYHERLTNPGFSRNFLGRIYTK